MHVATFEAFLNELQAIRADGMEKDAFPRPNDVREAVRKVGAKGYISADNLLQKVTKGRINAHKAMKVGAWSLDGPPTVGAAARQIAQNVGLL